ncbi:RidA family protein [Microbacteriaceae bacterium VKM Ac-2854]|nr:RidA family protein [Microbacteriaceae bacterium VKM Ac-2854]
MKTAVSTPDAPNPAGAYSQGIVANGFLYTAGFGPQNVHTGETAEGIEAQTRQCLANVAAVLATQGLDFSDVVKSTVHLQNLAEDFPGFNAVYREIVPEPLPVRTTVGSQLANILVEIDVVAALR